MERFNVEKEKEVFKFASFHDKCPMSVGDSIFDIYKCDIYRALRFRYSAFPYMKEYFSSVKIGIEALKTSPKNYLPKYREINYKNYHIHSANSMASLPFSSVRFDEYDDYLRRQYLMYAQVIANPFYFEFLEHFKDIAEDSNMDKLNCTNCKSKKCMRTAYNWSIDEKMIRFIITQFYIGKSRDTDSFVIKNKFDKIMLDTTEVVGAFKKLPKKDIINLFINNRIPFRLVTGNGRCLEILMSQLLSIGLIDDSIVCEVISYEKSRGEDDFHKAPLSKEYIASSSESLDKKFSDRYRSI